MKNYKLGASDGDIGEVKEFYFDDQSWTVRYLVADTGGWLSGQRVLISPYALDQANEEERVIPVHLTRTQIEKSPSLATDTPVSRQYELDYHSYYAWPTYWDSPYTGGLGNYFMSGQDAGSGGSLRPEAQDPHLRSTKDVTGHTIQAKDGEIGHVQDFVVDDEKWAIRYLIVDTQNWWPGKQILISTRWIERISWEESKVFINLTREAIRQGPEYTHEALITRDHEAKLHRHHNLDGYWAGELATKSMR